MRNNMNPIIFISIVLLLISTSLSAKILTQYRNNGIKNIQKQMDYELTQSSYWKQELKNFDTRFGFMESYNNILTCDKTMSTLTLYMKDFNNSYRMTKEYNAFTGKVKGDKAKEGDLKTPVGIYNITKKISKVDSFYGPLAFVTSYPNIYDIYRGKNGSGIWIHGLPTEQERDEFTKGCIAINNSSIECLDRNINIDKTILVIHEETEKKNTSKKVLANILAEVYAWRYAWLYNNTEDYLDFYAPEFIRVDGMSYDFFKNYKRRIFNKKEHKEIIFTKLNVIPYPDTKNLFKITFYETYKSNSFSFQGDKVLVVKIVNNKMKIITEQ